MNPDEITCLGGPLDGKTFMVENFDDLPPAFLSSTEIGNGILRSHKYVLMATDFDNYMVLRYYYESFVDVEIPV